MTDTRTRNQTGDADVIIVGFGPVGCVLAGLLARRGVRVIVLERDLDVFALPRAAHFDHEIMRVLQELGCADEIDDSIRHNLGMDFLTADRQVLLSMRSAERTSSGWPASIMFHQPGFERTLRVAAERAGADIRLGTEVTGVETVGAGPDEHVEVWLSNGEVLTAAWAVGCDGARSLLRKLSGTTVDDLGFEEPWLVLDLVLHDGCAEPSQVALQVCDPARPHTLVPMPHPRYRFEFMLLEGEDPLWIQQPDVVDGLLSAWLDPSMVTVERTAVYTFHGLIAQRWRTGRVLLAGDAAHQMPPFLGQGMCSGIRDAANLAWKLDLAIRAGAGTGAGAGASAGADSLLDSYQQERSPHVRAIVESAVGFGRLICTLDRQVAAERDAAMLAARAADDSPIGGAPSNPLQRGLLVDDGGGAMSVQVDLDGVRSDDVIGATFAVVARTPDLLTTTAAESWRHFGAVLLDAVTHPSLGPLLDAAGGDVAVIRPDRYLLSVGAACGELPQVLRH